MAAVGRIGRALRRTALKRSTPPEPPTAKKAAPAKKAPAKKAAAAKDAPAKKTPAAKKAIPTKKAPAAKKAPATKKAAPAKKAPGKKAPGKKTPAAKKAAAVTVPSGSEWTRAELAEVRKHLTAELVEMRSAYSESMRDLDDLQRSSADGAGDDQADAGSKTFEREQEQSIAANRLDLMAQYERAVERIDDDSYGFCERCGKPIPKARLKAFPAATLDVVCKQREERR